MIDNGSLGLSGDKLAESHLDAIDAFNRRFWVAAGIPDDIASREAQRYYGDPTSLLDAIVAATPAHQRERVAALVHDPEFMSTELADQLADIHDEGGSCEEAAQAVLDRAFDVWTDEHPEWFASGIRPVPVPDWGPEDDDPERWARMHREARGESA
jgi:hypothetical protein